MNDDAKKMRPFDSFTIVYKILVWAGYCKPLHKPTRPHIWILHQLYRRIIFLMIVLYNIQHILYIIQVRSDIEKLLDCLMIFIPNTSLIIKISTVQIYSSRLDKVHEVLRGPIFAATDDQDAKILKNNANKTLSLVKAMNYFLSVTVVFWITPFFVKRYFNKNETVPVYIPFKTDTWAMYSLSVLIECGPILWIGYGHISLDILVAIFYGQAQTQLRMIKYQLGRVSITDEEWELNKYSSLNFQYKDLIDEKIFQRFVLVVKRFEKLIWFKNEIDSVFSYYMSYQFLSAASGVCLVIYRMTVVSVTSLSFIFLVLLFFMLLTQVFLYCYYGNLVEFESRSVNSSLYLSDWLSLSPQFRRLLLTAMCRWGQPIQPKVCGFIPLSLSTFLQILKSSYTLYTVLVTAKPKS